MKTFTRIVALLTAAVALAIATIGSAQAQKPPAAAPRIEYKFGPEGQVGLTVLLQDQRVPLTYSDTGETNSTVLRIDGRDVEFGSAEGSWQRKPVAIAKGREGPARHGHWGVWGIDKIKVTQVVEVLTSHTGKLDTCLIYYLVENTDSRPHNIGLRAMIDTQIASNDGNSFAVAGRTVTNSADFKSAKDVPATIDVRETSDPKRLGVVAHLTVKLGGTFEAPDRCSLTNWPGPAPEWEVPLEDIEEDAAVALYWNPRRFEANGRRMIGYAYGQGMLYVKTGN